MLTEGGRVVAKGSGVSQILKTAEVFMPVCALALTEVRPSCATSTPSL